MDYTIRYGLEFNPFLKNSKEIFVSTDESKEVLFRLDYLAKTKGFGLLTGSPGRGKATAIRKWVQTLNNSQYKVVYTCFSTFSPNDFYRNLATELGAQAHYRKPDNFRVIQEELTRLSVEKRKTPVIIIDEANYISSAILNDFKLLFNFEMDSRDRAVVLLSGLPSLNATLRLSVHEPFRQRIIMNYELPVFTKEEKQAWLAQASDITLGSDAFFPFSDNIERAHKSGVKYIAEPGGSVRDDLVIETCDKYNMAMAFTGIRLFHH